MAALSLGALAANAADVTVTNGQTYTVAGGGETIDALTINSGGTLELGSETLTVVDNTNTTWAGTIHGTSDSGQIKKTGSGTVTLSNLVMDGGELHLNGGAMQQSAGNSTIWYFAVGSDAGTGTMTMSGGTLTIEDTDDLWTPGKSPTLQVGDFGGTGVFNQTGGTVTLVDAGLNIGNQGGNGTYNLSGGTLALTGTTALYSLGRSTTDARNSVGVMNVSGTGLLDIQVGNFVIGDRDAGGTLATTSGKLVQTGGTVRVGAGAGLFLSGFDNAGAIDGQYDLNGGTLEIGGTSLIARYNNGTAGYLFNLGGGTIKVIGSALTTDVNATLAGGTTSTIDTNGFGATFSGVLSGPGALLKTGAGTLTLTGANTFNGGMTLQQGTLAIAHATALGSGLFSVTGNATLQFDSALTVTNQTSVADGVVLKLDSGSFTSTMSGAIFGAGGIVKQGSGQITLGASSGYSGVTRIDAGTLVAGVANALPTGGAYLVNGGTLDLNDFALTMFELSGTGGTIDLGTANLVIAQTTNTTYAGAITGSGGLSKVNTGTLILTGASNYTGPTLAAQGGLIVNGSITSAVTVAGGGLLGGNGSVGGITVQAFGTLSPGNSIDTIDVNGPVTFDPSSIYLVEIDDQGNSDLTAATGIVTINGGTLAVDTSAGFVLGTPYTILSGSAIAGPGFETVATDFVFLDVDVDYGVTDPTEVQMTLSRNGLSFGAIGGTPNQEAVGEGVESLGAGNPLYDAVIVLTSEDEIRDAFDQLSGEIHPSLQTALLDDSRFVRDAVLGRLTGAPGTAQAPVAGTPFTAWFKAYGSWGSLDGNDEVAGLDRSIGGMFVGLDRALDDTWTVGLVGGYGHSEIDVDDRHSSASVDTYQIAAYGGGRFGALGLRLGAGYAWHEIDTSRSVGFTGFSDDLDASYGAGTTQVFAEAGYRVDAAPAMIEPFAGIAYVNVDMDGFDEDGGAAALGADGSSSDAVFTTLGIRASADLALDGGNSLSLRGMVGWRHAFADTPDQTFAFDGGSDFVVEGLPLAEDTFVLEAGLGMQVSPGVSVGLSYSGQIGDRLNDHGLNATLSVSF